MSHRRHSWKIGSSVGQTRPIPFRRAGINRVVSFNRSIEKENAPMNGSHFDEKVNVQMEYPEENPKATTSPSSLSPPPPLPTIFRIRSLHDPSRLSNARKKSNATVSFHFRSYRDGSFCAYEILVEERAEWNIITMFFSGGGKKSRSQKGGGSVGKETKDVITHIPITSDPESFHWIGSRVGRLKGDQQPPNIILLDAGSGLKRTDREAGPDILIRLNLDFRIKWLLAARIPRIRRNCGRLAPEIIFISSRDFSERIRGNVNFRQCLFPPPSF